MTAAKNVREALDRDTAIGLIEFWWRCVEAGREIDGDDALADDAVILHYSGCGASAIVTAGHFRALLSATAAGDDTGHWPSRCDWPKGRRFSVRDEPGEHDPCFLVMPSGGMIPFVTHATNGVDQARCKFIAMACNGELQIIDERDSYHDRLDELAAAVASHFGQDIGEHGSDNCPWDNALELLAAQESP